MKQNKDIFFYKKDSNVIKKRNDVEMDSKRKMLIFYLGNTYKKYNDNIK